MARSEHDKLHDYGLDRVQRKIFFGIDSNEEGEDYAGFNSKTVDIAIKNMNILVNDNSKKPIELHVGSTGGLIYDALRLVDYIEDCPCQVIFYGSGCIMSAATIIMCVCDERYIYRNSQIMLHNLSSEYDGKLTDLQLASKHDENLQNLINNIYASNSRMPRSFYDELLQRDLYLKPEEAIQLGLADFIVEPKKRGNLRKRRMAQLDKHPDSRKLRQLVDKLNKRIMRNKLDTIEVVVPEEQFDPAVVIDNSGPSVAVEEPIQIEKK